MDSQQEIRVEVRCEGCRRRIAWIDVEPDNANGSLSFDMRFRWKARFPPIHQTEAPDGHITYRFSCRCGAAPEIRHDRLESRLGIDRLLESRAPGVHKVYV